MVTRLLPLHLSGATVRRRGKRLLGPVDLKLDAGRLTVLLGPNGSGKTTLLRVMHGVERLSEGRISWAGPDDIVERDQAFVFQTPIMLRRSVLANLAYPLKLAGVGRASRNEQARDWAQRIGLGCALDTPAPRLSGGERQKLALARALIRKPQVLFLDEPCASLDGAATRDIEDLLRQARSDGITILMATHDMGQARRLADDVIFMVSGAVHERGDAQTTLSSPETTALRAFLNGDILP
ncbi:sulfate ABC transporter ATP-binding protein [Loktanella sp. 3ANDIMAR09]|uniref:ATP-binding cassette domain-containing protein n=1 Tax=Loktanella sp. 3ANDIMAR09 TaxID=1225657 RepID=UPI0007017C2A|nr:ATP-binding cassette domain-containing protein [Loktanella sp. 3ANDIMAR09]KQI69804.1 sulfate ABC transporter ATP-binding protein [Loktanella sp. 3ANDIMAR09]